MIEGARMSRIWIQKKFLSKIKILDRKIYIYYSTCRKGPIHKLGLLLFSSWYIGLSLKFSYFFEMPINWKPVILLATKYWPAYWPKNDFKTHRIILVSSKHNVIGQWFWLVSILTSYKPNEYTQYPVPFYEQTLHAKLGFFKVTQMSHILWVRGKFFRTQKVIWWSCDSIQSKDWCSRANNIW